MIQSYKNLTVAAVGVVLSLGSMELFAHEEGDFILRVGAAHVSPNDESSNVLSTDDGVTVESTTGLGFSGTWMLDRNWGFEVLAALPFEHDIEGKGSLSGLPIGSTKHLPPTMSLQYYFDTEGDSVHPYFGVGVNYTYFFDEEASPELKTALGTDDVELSLDNSVGLAVQLGADWKVGDDWFINTGVWYVDINTDADVIVNGATATTVEVEIDPWVAMVGFAWRF